MRRGKAQQMKIHWKRILVAGIWSELLLLAIYLSARRFAGPAFFFIAFSAVVGTMFLAGLWTARTIKARFLFHGVLVGIAANTVYVLLRETMAGNVPSISPIESWGRFFTLVIFKTLVCSAGAYAGGRLGTKPQPNQTFMPPF